MMDSSEIYVEELSHMIINLYKTVFEEMGYDLGSTNNKIEYRNYLYSDPIHMNSGSNDLPYDQDPSLWDNDNLPIGLGSGEPGDTGLSDGMVNFICFYETGHQFGYSMPSKELNGYDLGDAGGHKTFGYGLLYHPNGKYMDSIKKSWSQSELENLFKIHIKKTADTIDKWAKNNNITLTQRQKDAIASACYNFGLGFLSNSGKVYSNVVNMIKKDPNNPNIVNAWAHMSDAQGKKYPGLIKRRIAEAKWYGV